jgi:hypothetical protein
MPMCPRPRRSDVQDRLAAGDGLRRARAPELLARSRSVSSESMSARSDRRSSQEQARVLYYSVASGPTPELGRAVALIAGAADAEDPGPRCPVCVAMA